MRYAACVRATTSGRRSARPAASAEIQRVHPCQCDARQREEAAANQQQNERPDKAPALRRQQRQPGLHDGPITAAETQSRTTVAPRHRFVL